MNKILLLSAAAVLAGTAGAHATTSQYSFQFGTSGGGSYCDGGIVNEYGIFWSWQHTNNDCYGGTSYGLGLLGKVKGYGKIAVMSDNVFGNSDFVISVGLPAKIKDGNTWYMFCAFSGTSSFECNSGPLINVNKLAKTPPKSKRSLVASVKALMELHKAKKD
jgi:hypothetical protein